MEKDAISREHIGSVPMCDVRQAMSETVSVRSGDIRITVTLDGMGGGEVEHNLVPESLWINGHVIWDCERDSLEAVAENALNYSLGGGDITTEAFAFMTRRSVLNVIPNWSLGDPGGPLPG